MEILVVMVPRHTDMTREIFWIQNLDILENIWYNYEYFEISCDRKINYAFYCSYSYLWP